MQQQRGCKEDAKGTVWDIEGTKVKRCPQTLVKAETYKFLQAYSWYSKGFLPLRGGMLNQTNRFLNAINIIGNEIAESEQDGKRK